MLALKTDPVRYSEKTVMVVGAGRIQEPAIKIAKALGLKVVAVDYDPQAPGLKWADHPLIISTIEADACIEAAKTYKIDGVMTAGSDRSSRTVAAVAQVLNLPGIPVQVANNTTNKLDIRRIMADHQIPSPSFAIIQSQAEAVASLKILGLPLVVKPPDNNSSLGISVVENATELEKALNWAKRYTGLNSLVLEEFIAGEEIGIQSFVFEGEVHVAAISSRKITPPPYCSSTCTTVPALLPEDVKAQVEQNTIKAVQAMGIINGPVYLQMRLSREGPRLLELTPRLGGGYTNSHLIPLALGFNPIQAAIDLCLDFSPQINPQLCRGASRQYIIPDQGTVQHVPGLEQFFCPELVALELFIKPGDVIPEYYSAAVASGYVVTTGDSPDIAEGHASRLCRDIESKLVIS